MPGPSPSTPASRRAAAGSAAGAAEWRAIEARDWRADGRFVYAVTTTGIYCRPSCPSRRPARGHVRLFPDAASAEHAGFRACRRCAPQARASAAIEAVERARAWLDRHAGERVGLAALARAVGLSPHHLQRSFTRLTGVSPREYAAALRQRAFRGALRQAPRVTDAVYDAGYGSPSRAYERAGAHLGMTPGAFRAGARGERIAYDVVASRLGKVLVAATHRGLCLVAFGAGTEELERRLVAEFTGASVERAPGRVARWVTEVLGRIDGREARVDIPLDVQATVFQERVWRALLLVPRGETRSYGEVAASLGRRSAARAVARACASNPVAVVVPCHRVVPADGTIGGYRWGPDRKRRLLDAEQTGPARGSSAHALNRERGAAD